MAPAPAPVTPSPEGVPGAVSDPTSVLGEDLTFPGSAGDSINGYLAAPADAAGRARPSGIDRDPRGGRPRRAHPRRDQPLREPRLCGARRGPVHARRRAPAGGRHAGADGAPVRDVRRDRARRPRGRRRLSCARAKTATGGSAASASAWAVATRCCSPAPPTGSTRPWTAGAGSSDAATPEERSTPLRPTPPLELAGELSCPLLAAVGAEDQNPSPEIGEQLRERAAASGQEVTVDVYEGAGHAFFADYRPSYRPEPAAKLWERIVPFFARHLGPDEG